MSQKRIALIGAGGQLATDLEQRLRGDVLGLTHRDLEILDPDAVARRLDELQPDLVVNTAGYNLVDQAESDPQPAFAVNAIGVRNLAIHCGRAGLPLVHISTDYVFGGEASRTEPFTELDCPQPLGVYAASKLAGEHFVQAYCQNHLIVRTCGLYGVAATRAKGNFIETMLRLGQTRSSLRVVHDQHCTPSYTQDVADAIAGLIEVGASGLFHVTNSGATTWCALASEVFRLSGMNVEVVPITSAEFGAAARRPAYSVLDLQKTETAIARTLPPWQDAVARYLQARASRTE